MTSRPRGTPGLIFPVESAVQRYNFSYSIDLARDTITFELVTQEAGTFGAQFVVAPKQEIVRLFIMLDDPAEPSLLQERIETAIRVSRQLAVGSLEMDCEDGVVWFRHACDMEHVSSVVDMAEAMMTQSVFALNLYRTAQRFVASGSPPAQAVEAALLVLDAA